MSKKNKKKIKNYFFNVNFFDSFDKIKKVHKDIPNFDFDCKNCNKNCCVSPFISIVEFIYVVKYILKNFEKPHEILYKYNGRRKSDGVLICPFLDDQKRCLIYPVRHYKCRIIGMDILDHVFIDSCDHKKDIGLKSPKITKDMWLGYVDLLTRANKGFNYDTQKEFQTWMNFYFEDEEKLNDNEKKIRQFIKEYLNIEEYIPNIDNNDLL